MLSACSRSDPGPRSAACAALGSHWRVRRRSLPRTRGTHRVVVRRRKGARGWEVFNPLARTGTAAVRRGLLLADWFRGGDACAPFCAGKKAPSSPRAGEGDRPVPPLGPSPSRPLLTRGSCRVCRPVARTSSSYGRHWQLVEFTWKALYRFHGRNWVERPLRYSVGQDLGPSFSTEKPGVTVSTEE